MAKVQRWAGLAKGRKSGERGKFSKIAGKVTNQEPERLSERDEEKRKERLQRY